MKITFNEEDLVPNNKYLGVGEHEVTITSIEEATAKSGNPKLVFEFSDKHGRTAQEHVSLNAKFKILGIARAAGVSEQAVKGVFDTDVLKGKKLLLVKKQTGVTMVDGKERKEYSSEYFSSKDAGTAANFETDSIPF